MDVFTNRLLASNSAAHLIFESISAQLQKQERASVMVSGGSTPAVCFEALSKTDLPWSQIDITTTDEREVPPTHPDSNEKMVREKLMISMAASANFIRLEGDMIRALHPFSCTLVGMGEDGHFASLFPDSPQLEEGLHSTAEVIKVSTPSSPYERFSATLNTLCASELIIVLAFGDKKRKLLETPEGYPIAHLLKQQNVPVRIFWAP
ncbi:MAG: 6-phosphogluconolactonase [Candidatus Azotimanducaceae bacterium]|jgi:6-phosphogluconolactonase